MLLQNLIAEQQQKFAAIEAQIQALQEEQRQIQAFMQQLGSVESKMASAAQLVQEAIASINQICPDELDNYKLLVTGLFNSPIAQLPSAEDDNDGDDEPDPTPGGGGEPQEHKDGSSIDADFVEMESEENVDESTQKSVLINAIDAGIQDLSWTNFRTYLVSKGMPVKGKKKDELKRQFLQLLTSKTADELLLILEEISSDEMDSNAA